MEDVEGIIEKLPVTIERDADLASLAGCEVLMVSSVGARVSAYLIVSSNVGESAEAGEAGCHGPAPVALQGGLLRLIESDPELDPVSELLVTNPETELEAVCG